MNISFEQLEQAVNSSKFAPELREIKQDLWAHRASVLVGSGFSKNANQCIPSWDDWAKQLADKMELDYKQKERIKAQDVPWLAGAYATRHGFSKMRELLLEPMCNITMLQDDLHRTFVSLPWADIFTTNYDEFLEQASENIKKIGIFDKPRHVIKTGDNLMRSRNEYRSRIIKLHGCLSRKGEEGRCIITEEDYRTYKNKYANLVNTFRQSLLETIFCLIGYSATDPDFLEWNGWVHDKLKEEKLKIYWFSKDDTSENEKYIYAQRKITYIGLNCFNVQFDTQAMPKGISGNVASSNTTIKNSDPHYIIYTNFFQWLSKNEENVLPQISIQQDQNDVQNTEQNSSDKNTTPDFSSKKFIDTITDAESVTLTKDCADASDLWDYPDIPEVRFGQKKLNWDDIQNLSMRMKQAREAYPGWILPPIKILHRLWHLHIDAHSFVNKIIQMRSSVSKLELLVPLREVCWLLEMACLPAFNKLDKSLEKILDVSLPEILSKHKGGHDINQEYATLWMACSRLLLRWTREECDKKSFANIAENMEKLLKRFPDPETSAFLKHQHILLRLENFDRSGALRLLRIWRLPTKVAKIWFIHQAMLLGELGDVRKGYSLLKKLYDELVPQASQADCPPEILSTARLAAGSLRLFSLLPEGGWLTPEEKKRYSGIPSSFQDILPPLRKSEPDISIILEKLQVNMKAALASAQVVPSKILFETGRRNNSRHLYSGFTPGGREACLCIGVMEKLGRSPYLGYASFDISAWLGSAQLFFYLQKGLNVQTLRILLRSAPGDTFKAEQDIFLQYYLTDFDEPEARELSEQIFTEITTILAKRKQAPLDEHYACFGLELLSRFCMRISDFEAQQKFFDLALEWRSQGPIWKHIGAFDQMCLFCRRVIESVPYSLLKRNLASILSSPVLMGFPDLLLAGHHLYFSASNADIITFMPFNLPDVESTDELCTISARLWKELTEYEVVLKNPDIHPEQVDTIRKTIFGRYYWRLLWMLQHGLVDMATCESMGKHIWSGYEQCGLPVLPNMYPGAILDWPVLPGINVEERYKISLLQQVIPSAYTINSDGRRSYSSNYTAPLYEYLCIGSKHRERLNLSHHEKLQILTTCYENDFREDADSIEKNYLHQPLNSLVWILTYVFSGSLKDFEQERPWLPEWITGLISYGDDIGARCQQLKVLNLLFNKTEFYAENLILTLEEDIYSTNRNRQIEAGFSILLWRSEIKNPICPDSLYNAALRGFWLMEEKHATSLVNSIIEHFKYYPQLHISDNAKRILLRALDNKRQQLNYEQNKKLRFFDKKDWLNVKEALELLPEHRINVGKMIATICNTHPEWGNENAIKLWIEEMKNDPLSSMHREGEEAERLLKRVKG